jgi:hypothetical protein
MKDINHCLERSINQTQIFSSCCFKKVKVEMSIVLDQTDYKNKETIKGVLTFNKSNLEVESICMRVIKVVHFDKDYIKELVIQEI